MTKGLLAGIRVLDLTRVLAGPYCTMMLGDLGADVIKVEQPEKGDDTRHWGPPFICNGLSAYFISANRNKRSITLDLQTQAGKDILAELVKVSDVVVENFKTGTMDRLGFGYSELKQLKPDIVYCSITGYGQTGPYSDRPGYDFISQALGGMMSVTGEVDGEPVRVGVAIVDIMAGQNATMAINAALVARERQKVGQRIDISLLDTQVAAMVYVASNYLVSKETPKRYGNAHPNIVPYQAFKAKDGFFAFAAGNDLQWAHFCEQAGRPEWIEDPRFATNPSRVTNRNELIEQLDDLFAAQTIAHWIDVCEKAGVPSAPINSFDQTVDHPQVKARELVTSFQMQNGEEIEMLTSPLKIPTDPTEIRLPPPLLGEHTDSILHELLAYPPDCIEQLHSEGAI